MVDPLRVLVVDDDAAVQGSMMAYLEDEGFILRSADSASAALAVLEGEPIDVAIVDIRLREMDGETLILRGRSVRPDTRFLIYTGSSDYRLPESLALAGMSQADVLYKPVRTLKTVVDQIRRLSKRGADQGCPG